MRSIRLSFPSPGGPGRAVLRGTSAVVRDFSVVASPRRERASAARADQSTSLRWVSRRRAPRLADRSGLAIPRLLCWSGATAGVDRRLRCGQTGALPEDLGIRAACVVDMHLFCHGRGAASRAHSRRVIRSGCALAFRSTVDYYCRAQAGVVGKAVRRRYVGCHM